MQGRGVIHIERNGAVVLMLQYVKIGWKEIYTSTGTLPMP